MMEVIIERKLNRLERLALIMKQIEEAELHGYGNITISFHNHQIANSSLTKDIKFGNCTPEMYFNP